MLGLLQESSAGAVLAAGSWEPYWHFSGVFHPAVAHFPIALLLVAALVESWSIVRRSGRPFNSTIVCLYIGTLAAIVAAVLGWASADASGEKGELLQWHRWLGVAVAGLAVVAVVLSLWTHREKINGKLLWAYRGTVFASAALVGLVGSYGGKLVHGESYYEDALALLNQELSKQAGKVTKSAVDEVKDATKTAISRVTKAVDALPPNIAVAGVVAAPGGSVPVGTPTTLPTTVPTTSPAAAGPALAGGGLVSYARDIEPIFVDRCISCHGEKKVKGDYRMDTRERMFTAGESTKPPIVPGKSDESHLIQLVEAKGEFEDSIMPPKGDPLTPEQIALIRKWIDEGASNP